MAVVVTSGFSLLRHAALSNFSVLLRRTRHSIHGVRGHAAFITLPFNVAKIARKLLQKLKHPKERTLECCVHTDKLILSDYKS